MVIRAPFFEIGPKAYLYGDRAVSLARAAAEAAKQYDVTVFFTPQLTDISRIVQAAPNLLVIAPHMDALPVGRGVGSVLPEAVKAAGAAGVMLNHVEKLLAFSTLWGTRQRAKAVGLITLICADSLAEIRAVAQLAPEVLVAEPSELIGAGTGSDMDYMSASIAAVKAVDPGIRVLQGAGIRTPEDVYRVILAGAEGTGSSSGVALAKDPETMAVEMIRAVRAAWDAR